MQNKLSIGEMAKLRNVSVDTLRHYDKMGLLKPHYTDPDSGYRYYSIGQYEVLGTIKELRSIGFSIEEIKDYLTNRHVKKSVRLLRNSMERMLDKIRELQKIHDVMTSRLSETENFYETYREAEIAIKRFEEREYVLLEQPVFWNDDDKYSFGLLELENMIGGVIPVLASSKFGEVIPEAYFDDIRTDGDSALDLSAYQSRLFILVQQEETERPTRKLEPGLYACTCHKGLYIEKMLPELRRLLHYCDTHGYAIKGDAVRIMQVDISLTDQYEEAYYEIQIPVQEPRVMAEAASKSCSECFLR